MDTTASDRPERRTALVAAELKRYNVDIAALSETRLADEGSLVEVSQGYTFFWKGQAAEERRIHGVGFAIRNEIVKTISETPVGHNERLMSMRLPLSKNQHTTIISAYGPTLDAEEEAKDKFYEDLEDLFQRIPHCDKLILLGDFNARVGTDCAIWPAVLGRHGVGNMNANGLRLLSFCAEHGLSITNTMFQQKNKYKTTWMHPRSHHWHMIDYIMVRRRDLKDVHLTRVMRGANCWTDHRMVCAVMHIALRPPLRQRQSCFKRLNTTALQDQTKARELQQSVSTVLEGRRVGRPHLQDVQLAELDETWEELARDIYNCSLECLGTVSKRNRDWFDENDVYIQDILKEKNKMHDACLANPSAVHLKVRWQQKRAEVQLLLRDMQNEWWITRAREIQNMADENKIHEFYEAIKCVCGPVRNPSAPLRSADGQTLIKDKQGIMDRWAEHFQELLNTVNPVDLSAVDDLPVFDEIPEMDNPPQLEEVESIIDRLKNRKSPGPDGIPAEVFKHGGRDLLVYLHKFFTLCWNREVAPRQWRTANIVPIYKRKGERSICGNSRGVSLLDVAGKVFGGILLNRLNGHFTERVLPESQCGFRADRSTNDMIFACRQLFEKCGEQNQPISIAFIDLKKAFDTVNREVMYGVLARFGCPPKFVNLIRQLHEGTMARVAAGGNTSEQFSVEVGVKQGCVLAPVLFNVFLVAVTLLANGEREEGRAGIGLRYRFDGGVFNLRRLKARTKTHDTVVSDLQYADDAAVVAHTPDNLQGMLSDLSTAYNRVGLRVNTQKTEVMCRGVGGVNISIDGEPLQLVEHFTYLGSIISQDGSIDCDIANRIQQASRAFGRLRERVFLNNNLRIHTKVAVYRAVCVSTLLYGSESWTVYRKHMQTLEAFHMRCLKRILRISWMDRFTNNEVLRRATCTSLEACVLGRTLRWAGHLSRMGDGRIPKQIFFGELAVGVRHAGGPKKRYKDYLKRSMLSCNLDPGQFEVMADDRALWRSAVTNGISYFEDSLRERRDDQRQRRHEQRLGVAAGGEFTCLRCNRQFRTRSGLLSHQRAHERRAGRGRHRIDGLP